jgi:hypothetical protein
MMHMNRFIFAALALTLAAVAHGADGVKAGAHTLVYGSSVASEIDPCG